MKILLLQGGTSSERTVSLRSTNSVARALRANNHTVLTYDTHEGLEGLEGIVQLLPRSDVVFPIIYSGEDGTVQQLLEDYRIPYVGAGVAGSQHCFNKIAAKQLLTESGLPTPKWAEVDVKTFITSPLAQRPYVLKPILGNSNTDSFTIHIPTSQSVDLGIFDRHKTMLLEELITGTELAVGVLGIEALPVVEILPSEGQGHNYDHRELCPPQHIDETMQEEAQGLAEQAHQFLGARHYSRTDIMLSTNGQLSIVGVNAIPDLTEGYPFPTAAAAAGLSIINLVERLVSMALHGEQHGQY